MNILATWLTGEVAISDTANWRREKIHVDNFTYAKNRYVVNYPRGKIGTWVIYHVTKSLRGSITIITWRNVEPNSRKII
jgi:hypothetical protein